MGAQSDLAGHKEDGRTCLRPRLAAPAGDGGAAMNNKPRRGSWLVIALAVLCAGAVLAAALLVGPPSSSTATVTRTARVAQGVVQSTVSGSGNLEPASQLNLGFRTSGTVTAIYVHVGEQVAQGQLIATLDPESAEVTLEEARASLRSAEAALAKEQETDGAGTTGAGSGSAAPTTTAASSDAAAPATKRSGAGGGSSSASAGAGRSGSSGGASASSSSEASSTGATLSAATREANLASAKAAVSSARLTVQSDEQALQDTRLYAPESGTIVSLDGQVGEVVAASGTTRATSTASSSSSSQSAGAGTGATGAGRSSTGATGSSASSDSSASAFAILSDLDSMELVAPLSESEVGNVKPGQIATVTVEALEGRKLAAHVKEVAILATSSSGVVSYDVTFRLDQTTEGLRPGMSATAEAVVKQAEGLNVPSSAISADAVTVVRDGKDVRQRVVTGLAGNSTTIVLSGLSAGETVLLPSIATSTGTGTGTSSGFRRTGGLGGGIGGALGGGAFFRVGG